jgi:hypothetical protein
MSLILIIIIPILGFSAPADFQFRNYREILIFSPTKDNILLEKQLQIFEKDPDGLKERDLKVSVNVWNAKQDAMYRRWKIDQKKFTLILIGKDGQAKFRSEKPTTLKQLYSIIDVMPMRRSEMKKQ